MVGTYDQNQLQFYENSKALEVSQTDDWILTGRRLHEQVPGSKLEFVLRGRIGRVSFLQKLICKF